MATMISPATWKLTSLRIQPSSPSSPSSASRNMKPPHCSPIQQEQTVDVAIMCQPCNGRGWLLCDFCKGQKTNVKSETNRIYRRCPSCRAIGQVLCSKCKVFKCVTFPNYEDGEEVSFVSVCQCTDLWVDNVRRCMWSQCISVRDQPTRA